MSEGNPFGDPEAANPFAQPPPVSKPAPIGGQTTDSYQPYNEKPQIPPPVASVPPPYQPTPSLSDDLNKRSQELDKKEAEISRREQELNNQTVIKTKNFPPFPSICPIQPCFYQDISVEIPVEFQKLVRSMYLIWIAYVVILLINLVISLLYLCLYDGGEGGRQLILSVVYFGLFTPCSFVCWFRPVYNAFKNDSSFNFFLFFFIFFFQFIVTCIMCLGVDGYGFCGWINSMTVISHNKGLGIVMIMVAMLFSCLAGVILLYLIKVHRLYRNTGASFAKAQEEFAHGVMTNKTVQQTAGNIARESVANSMSGNRY